MLLAHADAAALTAQDQPYFSFLANEVRDQRCGLDHAEFKASRLGGVLAGIAFGRDGRPRARVQPDIYPTLIFGGEFLDHQIARARGRLPIDVPQIVLRLVVSQRKEILANTAPG